MMHFNGCEWFVEISSTSTLHYSDITNSNGVTTPWPLDDIDVLLNRDNEIYLGKFVMIWQGTLRTTQYACP